MTAVDSRRLPILLEYVMLCYNCCCCCRRRFRDLVRSSRSRGCFQYLSHSFPGQFRQHPHLVKSIDEGQRKFHFFVIVFCSPCMSGGVHETNTWKRDVIRTTLDSRSIHGTITLSNALFMYHGMRRTERAGHPRSNGRSTSHDPTKTNQERNHDEGTMCAREEQRREHTTNEPTGLPH